MEKIVIKYNVSHAFRQILFRLKRHEESNGVDLQKRKKLKLSLRNKKGDDEETRENNNNLQAVVRLYLKVLDNNRNCFRNEKIILKFIRKKNKCGHDKFLFKGTLKEFASIRDIKKRKKKRLSIESIIKYRAIWRKYILTSIRPKNKKIIAKIREIYRNPTKYGLEYEDSEKTIKTIENKLKKDMNIY